MVAAGSSIKLTGSVGPLDAPYVNIKLMLHSLAKM